LHFPEIPSTQTLAKTMAEDGADDWTLVLADRQTAGRGRMERTWNSAAGGLYFSLIIRPKFGPKRLADLSLAAAAAASETIGKITGLQTVVKPPNDVFAFAESRAFKVCGILAEARGDSKTLDWLVLGVGVNVNNDPDAENASSLKALTGRAWDAEVILKKFLVELRKKIRNL